MDEGARFLARVDRANLRRPLWEEWMLSPEWLSHAETCADPYCSLLWHPYGECGIRLPEIDPVETRRRRKARTGQTLIRPLRVLKGGKRGGST